jgi:alpha-L-fucosidase
VEAFINKKWVSIARGQSIGRKRIQTFDSIKTTKLRLSYTSDFDKGFIRSFTVYDADF